MSESEHTAPGNGIPVIKLDTIIAGLRDAIEYRLDRYAFCADCVKSIGGWCADHEEDHAAVIEYERIIALLEGGDAGERLRGLVKAAPPEEVADLIDWTELNP